MTQLFKDFQVGHKIIPGNRHLIQSFPTKMIKKLNIEPYNKSLEEVSKFLDDLDFRKVAYVVSKCNFMVSYEGFFNHIASCFEKKNVLKKILFFEKIYTHSEFPQDSENRT